VDRLIGEPSDSKPRARSLWAIADLDAASDCLRGAYDDHGPGEFTKRVSRCSCCSATSAGLSSSISESEALLQLLVPDSSCDFIASRCYEGLMENVLRVGAIDGDVRESIKLLFCEPSVVSGVGRHDDAVGRRRKTWMG
jgi:hypothetical protein